MLLQKLNMLLVLYAATLIAREREYVYSKECYVLADDSLEFFPGC